MISEQTLLARKNMYLELCRRQVWKPYFSKDELETILCGSMFFIFWYKNKKFKKKLFVYILYF
jgi:hypothetical protein